MSLFVWDDGMAPRYNMQFSEKCIEIDRILANKCDVGYMRVCVFVWHCRQWRLLLAMLFMMLIIIWYAKRCDLLLISLAYTVSFTFRMLVHLCKKKCVFFSVYHAFHSHVATCGVYSEHLTPTGWMADSNSIKWLLH